MGLTNFLYFFHYPFLHSINKDWENRLAVRLGIGKRVERKVKPVEKQIENNNVWKSKQAQVAPTLPRAPGLGPISRPGVQRKGLSNSAPNNKDRKGQIKSIERLQLLMFISQTQPSAMVWGKSWKYNKSLPLPEKGTVSNWGSCWMFAIPQPFSEPGKPWPNGPNLMEPHSLHLWVKPDYRVVESKELDLSLPTLVWQMCWKKSDNYNKKGHTSLENEKNNPKPGFFTLLVETQRHNEDLCSSEWHESWRSMKPESKQDSLPVSNDSQMNESVSNKKDIKSAMSSNWEECWRLVNHHGCNKSKLHEVKNSHSLEWANSWRAAIDLSRRQDYSDNYNECSLQEESNPRTIMLVSHEQKYRDVYLQLCEKIEALSEWNKSWQVTKNNSKPCEELEKVLKVVSSKMETALETQKLERNAMGHDSTSDKTDPCYEQLKHSTIYFPKRILTRSNLLLLEHQTNSLSASNWRDSWKTLKHRMRMERRRMRPDPLRPFRASENGVDLRSNNSEWRDSWKFTCQPLHQQSEQWQQGWTTMPQIRRDRAMDQNHFMPVELPKNGPTGERSWAESWRLFRSQPLSELGQGRAQASQGRSSMASHHPDNSQAHRSVRQSGHASSGSDWQESWMVSETEFQHDIPSLTQWREAWRWSVFNTEQQTVQPSREDGLDVLMEIKLQRENISMQQAKAKMSRSFEKQMFRERYPEKEWKASWRAEFLLNHQLSHCSSSEKSISCTSLQHHVTTNGHGSKWGMPFRIANPMPQLEQSWLESSPNLCQYIDMWSKEINTHNNTNTNLCNNPAFFRLWGKSHQFLQGATTQIKDKTMCKVSVDPRVIMTKKITTRRHLYSNTEKEKQSGRKWVGCHLLGKTQPRTKKGPSSANKPKTDEENKEAKFFEEWAESWRFLVQPGNLKKQMSIKSLSGWDESWKFLLPPYQMMNGPKAR